MLIERKARSVIFQGIKIEKEMTEFEKRGMTKEEIIDCNEYNMIRKEFLKVIDQIIFILIANEKPIILHKVDLETLVNAENILKKVSSIQSKTIISLASKIKSSFTNLRNLFKKYDENIEAVDPQLKNNLDLIKVLDEFENYWEKGNNYLADPDVILKLAHFSNMIENVCAHHNEIKIKIEVMDSSIFEIIPCLIVLNSIDSFEKKILQTYFPTMEFNNIEINNYFEISQLYSKIKENAEEKWQLYHMLEMSILQIPIKKDELIKLNIDEDQLEKLIKGIKEASISLQKFDPPDWKALVETVMIFKEK